MTSEALHIGARRVLGPWRLADLKRVPSNGLKVFSCFHCGGGSTMGYKLAGYQVLGGVEIDPEMMSIYRRNHRPALSFQMGIQDFVTDGVVPEGLEDLDVLDGSPPCSSFSMCGARDRKWGKKAHFREGQVAQVLDDLFFEFIRVAGVLRPKVVIAENVKGLIQGKARGYVKEIFARLDQVGYRAQLFLLNAARMGVPQARERTFFVAVRKDISKKLSLTFQEPLIPLEQVLLPDVPPGVGLQPRQRELLELVRPRDRSLEDAYKRATGKRGMFNHSLLWRHRVCYTLTANNTPLAVMPDRRALLDSEIIQVQSFPEDFDFCGQPARYVCGMSVPPLMMQRLALEVGWQVFGVQYNRAAPRPLGDAL